MKRLSSLALALALLACSTPGAALANDFYPPSPVPSSRDNIRPKSATQKAPASWSNLKGGNKIVKTTKPAAPTQPITNGSTAQ